MSNQEDRNPSEDVNDNDNGSNDVNVNDTQDVPRSNVTVRIQYQYFTPEGLTEINSTNAHAEASAVGSSNPGSTDPTTIHNAGMGPGVSTTTRLASLSNNNATESPDLILSFQDVPLTSPERLNSFITIAAELAMRRFQELMNRPKGITLEAFRSLPTKRIEELPEKENSSCSICYEPFEDESEETDEYSKKRSRESSLDKDEENEDAVDSNSINKLQRTGSETPSSYMTAMSIGNGVEGERTSIPSILNPVGRENTNTHFNINQDGSTQSGSETTRPVADTGNPGASAATEQVPEEEPVFAHSPTELPCQHIFGRSCLYQWTRLENTCPLCRKRIIENNENERPQNNEGSSNMEAFEAIRRMLYNTTGAPPNADTAEGESNDDVSHPDATASPAPSNQENTANVNESASASSTSPAANQQLSSAAPNNNATISRTSIIFLRPMTEGELPQQGLGLPPVGQFPPGIQPPRASNVARTPMHIQWMPISLINPVTNQPDQGPPEQNNRLRSIFDHIFSASGSANTVDTPQPTEPNQQSSQESNQDTPRNSFFSAMSRIAGRLRSSQNNNNNDNATNENNQDPEGHTGVTLRDTISRALEERRLRANMPSEQSNEGIFSAGVGSYRNPDGRVSTFPINHNNPLNFTPTNEQDSEENRDQGGSNNSSNNDNSNRE
ncbi:Protein SAN1 [Nakaseomyces bracarensis]|uniref:Protein SAN1 n=1 Tax=Nakaseomyces bracarensis TaxID=273131 RepID=A0ABR4NTC2_9SACH